jgi:hypothetical protein
VCEALPYQIRRPSVMDKTEERQIHRSSTPESITEGGSAREWGYKILLPTTCRGRGIQDSRKHDARRPTPRRRRNWPVATGCEAAVDGEPREPGASTAREPTAGEPSTTREPTTGEPSTHEGTDGRRGEHPRGNRQGEAATGRGRSGQRRRRERDECTTGVRVTDFGS